MKILTAYKIQTAAYLLIILFGLQHYVFNSHSFNYIFYETVLNCFFIASVVIILLSVLIMIIESMITLNRKTVINTELKYLIINLVLYYAVIMTSFYLFTQIR
ncbi:MAG: hypothetical protein LBE92_17400 [Chryseobacterium sp.]|jgi:hypothetical protein|uniref:hypothetical protein n=1 Tax=Chryseobacterium sp. TaxID=1871047 RepID=UPI002838398C|nr:hypothetical protein [Chryseobacterium sp.]MDR2237903.1 hypothetical protein [Chryseobacterium sp.]